MLRTAVFASLFATGAFAANFGPGFKQQAVPVEGCTLNATVGGKGPTVLLLHGYAEAAQMWKPLAIKTDETIAAVTKALEQSVTAQR